jgi:hypothetical protein
MKFIPVQAGITYEAVCYPISSLFFFATSRQPLRERPPDYSMLSCVSGTMILYMVQKAEKKSARLERRR